MATIGTLKVQTVRMVKDNPFYGTYSVVTEMTKTIVNEKYVNLVSPKKGIHITRKDGSSGVVTDFFIGKYFITGESKTYADENTTFSTSFTYEGHVYEIEVDSDGELVSFKEWLSEYYFEDDNSPDNKYTKKSRGIKWETIDI